MILGFIFDSILSLDLEISSLGGLQNGGTIKRFDKKDILNGHQLLSIRSEIDDQKCFLYAVSEFFSHLSFKKSGW